MGSVSTFGIKKLASVFDLNNQKLLIKRNKRKYSNINVYYS